MNMSKINRPSSFSIFFLLTVAIKVAMLATFTSDYQIRLFVPFLNDFLELIKEGGLLQGMNVYSDFYNKVGSVAFPYPPLMLLIESLAIFFASKLGGGFAFEIVSKLPLLFFDLLGLYFLLKFFPTRRKIVGLLYFCSPIILYAIYMHGQLDIIPTSLLLGSLYFLFNKRKKSQFFSAVFLSLALLTKLHILAVVPAIFILLWKRKNYLDLFSYFFVVLFCICLVCAPFSGNEFWSAVLWNKEQSLLTQVYINFVDLKIYLPIMALIFIYLHEYMLIDTNRSLFFSLCGLLFGVFLILIPPMPGWYVWIVPFVTLYFVEVSFYRARALTIYIVLNLLFLLYFITAHRTPLTDLYFLGNDLSFLKVKDPTYVSVLFTLLTSTLIYIVYCMYKLGLSNNNFYKRKGVPFTIAISGDSGAGKSTLIEMMFRCFGKRDTLQIEGDGDHKWERNAPMWTKLTHLNPKANWLYRQAKDIAALKRGERIHRVDYDHQTGSFTKSMVVKPKRFIVLSGLHAFYLPQMRETMDLKLFMAPDEKLRLFWKIKRDTEKRGYSLEKILEQINKRKIDSDSFIAPQKKFADLVITYFDNTLEDFTDLKHKVQISLKMSLSLSVDVEPLLQFLEKNGMFINHEFSEDLSKQTISIDGNSLESIHLNFSKFVYELIPHYDEITEQIFTWVDNKDAIIQLVILLIISSKMRTN